MDTPGFRYNFFMANPAEPGEYYSITFWDLPEQAQVFFGGPGYAEIIAEIRDLLIAAPTRWGLEVVEALDLKGLLATTP